MLQKSRACWRGDDEIRTDKKIRELPLPTDIASKISTACPAARATWVTLPLKTFSRNANHNYDYNIFGIKMSNMSLILL